MNVNSYFSKNLEYLMVKNKVLKSDLIKITGVTRPTINSILTGESKGVSWNVLEKLAKYFDVQPHELLVANHYISVEGNIEKVTYKEYEKIKSILEEK